MSSLTKLNLEGWWTWNLPRKKNLNQVVGKADERGFNMFNECHLIMLFNKDL